MEATRPTSPPSGWMTRALKDYRVLLLDQRGTGRSTPVGTVIPGDTPEAQAEYLTHFRADSIVRDAELIRQELGVDRWSVLGQSFGGFCSMTYLSIAPDGLREAFITGGLSPIGRPVDDIYSATYRRVIERNERYFERYPEDRARVEEIHRRLDGEDVPARDGRAPHVPALPAAWGPAWRQCRLGTPPQRAGTADGFARVRVRRRGNRAVYPQPDLRDAPRVVVRRRRRDALVGRTAPPRRDPRRCRVHRRARLSAGCSTTIARLQPHKAAAEILAEHEWPRVYDAAQLAVNEVPVAATIYVDDLYVERAFAEETARRDPRAADVDHRRVRPQRPARRRRPRPRPADRPCAGARVVEPGGGRDRAVPQGTAFRRVPRGPVPKRHFSAIWESVHEELVRIPVPYGTDPTALRTSRRPVRVGSAGFGRGSRRRRAALTPDRSRSPRRRDPRIRTARCGRGLIR